MFGNSKNHTTQDKQVYSLKSISHHVNTNSKHDDLAVVYTELFEIKPALKNVFSSVFNCISLVSILGNFFIILAVLRCKRMHNVTNYFIINLAIADIIVSVLATPFQVSVSRYDLDLLF
jgi:hypothetical protein